MKKRNIIIIYVFTMVYIYFVLNMWLRFIELGFSAMEHNGLIIINFNRYGEMGLEVIIMIIGFITTLSVLVVVSGKFVKKICEK